MPRPVRRVLGRGRSVVSVERSGPAFETMHGAGAMVVGAKRPRHDREEGHRVLGRSAMGFRRWAIGFRRWAIGVRRSAFGDRRSVTASEVVTDARTNGRAHTTRSASNLEHAVANTDSPPFESGPAAHSPPTMG